MQLGLAADHRAVRRADVRGRAAQRARARSARSATASSAAWSSATPRTWIWCSCTTRTGEQQETRGAAADRQPGVLRAPRAAHRAPADDAFGRRPALRGRHAAAPERQGRHAGHEHRRLRASTSARRPGPGSTRRCCTRARWPARRRCARASRRCALEVLRNHVRRATLREEVRGMRERMRRELSRGEPANSTSSRTPAASPTSSSWRSTGRCSGRTSTRRWRCSPTPSASSSRWPRRTWCRRRRVDVLTGAYRAYRERTHHLSLDGRGAVVAGGEFAARARGGDRDLGCGDGR